jgi:hypothetical protein
MVSTMMALNGAQAAISNRGGQYIHLEVRPLYFQLTDLADESLIGYQVQRLALVRKPATTFLAGVMLVCVILWLN